MWHEDHIHAAAVERLRTHASALDLEQSPYGLDAITEVDLHPILAQGLEALPATVLREMPFPGTARGEAGKRPLRRERERCDLVLLPAGTKGLRDEVERLRAHDRAAGTLFESLAALMPDSDGLAGPDEACWLEVKLVRQWGFVDGFVRANLAYASELTGALRTDLVKLGREESIAWGGLVVVLLVESQRVAEHDLPEALRRALERGAVVRGVRRGGFGISDRIGNAWCEVAVLRAGRSANSLG